MGSPEVIYTDPVRYLSLDAMKVYLSVGRSSVEKIAAESGAKRKIGTRTVYDKKAIDEYMEKQADHVL